MGQSRVVVAVLALSACGHHENPGPGGADGGAITALAITPPAATVALTANAGDYSATQPYEVTATYADGSTGDVTADVTFAVDDANAVSFAS